MSPKGTPFALLGLLSVQPMSGYDLRREIRETLSFFWHESYGQIYPALQRLSAGGLIAATTPGERGGRRRRGYAVTSRGREALRNWLSERPRRRPVSDEFLLKVFLGALGDPDACRAHIRRHLAECSAVLAEYERIRRLVGAEHAGTSHMPYWRVLVAHGIAVRRAEIRWSTWALRTLADTQASPGRARRHTASRRVGRPARSGKRRVVARGESGGR